MSLLLGRLERDRKLKAIEDLAIAIKSLTEQKRIEFDWLKSTVGLATKQDLSDWKNDMAIKLSDVKKIVADSAGQAKEAFGEISTRLTDLQKQIDDLIAGVGDPEITDAAFLADLESLKSDTKSLADVVPTPQP